MVYRCDKQSSKLSQQLKHFYSCGEFCDVILYSRSSQIHAHRLILAAFSPYLYHNINRHTDRRNIAEIQLRNFDDRAVKAIVDFFYNGIITVDSDSAEQIFSLANTLQVKEVEKLCLTFLNAQQSFASEIDQDRKPHYDAESRRYNIVEPSKVESSSRSSPRTSPSVSTSGRPLSESGSVDTVDSDVVNIKTEVQDYSYESIQEDYREYYRERKKDNENRIKLTKSVVDMSHVQPKVTGQSMSYSQQYMFVRPPSPPPPPTLQMMAPQRESESTEVTDNSSSAAVKDQSYHSGEDSNNDVSLQESDPFSGPLEPMFECRICKQMFVARHSLEMHMVSVHGFTNQYHSHQKKRQRVSPGEVSPDYIGAMQCGTCGKYFRDAQSLKFHKYNHMLRFCCNVCGKRFSRSWNLHRHRKTHVRYGEVGMIMDNSGDDSMIENLTAEYMDEISSEMVDLTNTGEEGDTSRDMSSEKSDEEKMVEEASVSVSVSEEKEESEKPALENQLPAI